MLVGSNNHTPIAQTVYFPQEIHQKVRTASEWLGAWQDTAKDYNWKLNFNWNFSAHFSCLAVAPLNLYPNCFNDFYNFETACVLSTWKSQDIYQNTPLDTNWWKQINAFEEIIEKKH